MNTNFARRVVSGSKARFQEGGIDLDLAYITDQVIIMGFPADGLEALYRNRREDARRFLDERHKDNYWIFNLKTPIQWIISMVELADIHFRIISMFSFAPQGVRLIWACSAPPLAILPLAAREMQEWLAGGEHRVVVLHCKAGKGRSGTLACAYLLTLEQTPTPPRLQRSYAAKEWAERRAEMLINEVESDEEEIPEGSASAPVPGVSKENEPAASKGVLQTKGGPLTQSPSATLDVMSLDSTSSQTSPVSPSPSISKSSAGKKGLTLESVIALHTSRRMQTPPEGGKVKQGVSIPSQRRFLGYWSRLIDGASPAGMWAINKATYSNTDLAGADKQRVRLSTIRVTMRDDASLKQRGMKILNSFLDRAVGGGSDGKKGKGDVWVSLARYDDNLVELLEGWEQRTRSLEHGIGHREHGPEADRNEKEGEVALEHIFDDGTWDNRKMVRSFARMGVTDPKDTIIKRTHILHPLKYSKWVKVDKKYVTKQSRLSVPGAYRGSGDDSDAASASSMSTTATGVAAAVVEAKQQKEQSKDDLEEIEISPGVVLDARREVRAKLYMGQVPMGWMWFIPAFHMTEGGPESTIQLTRKDVDFPLGVGAWIEGVEIVLTRIEDESVEPTSTRADEILSPASGPAIRIQDAFKGEQEPPSRF
ncbi:Ptenb protein [Ceratobasidium theobromae]|uniref:phosphatidylinositol-3,4,5-trisphosphate 3-phosphatase n=1 Tax=Ceratobasidium theobromae TaxID=1582974 RepID=A0A5N5QGT4_9AGAM|nr:Ptenb protein [Ceratobasidium theobromae]